MFASSRGNEFNPWLVYRLFASSARGKPFNPQALYSMFASSATGNGFNPWLVHRANASNAGSNGFNPWPVYRAFASSAWGKGFNHLPLYRAFASSAFESWPVNNYDRCKTGINKVSHLTLNIIRAVQASTLTSLQQWFPPRMQCVQLMQIFSSKTNNTMLHFTEMILSYQQSAW